MFFVNILSRSRFHLGHEFDVNKKCPQLSLVAWEGCKVVLLGKWDPCRLDS